MTEVRCYLTTTMEIDDLLGSNSRDKMMLLDSNNEGGRMMLLDSNNDSGTMLLDSNNRNKMIYLAATVEIR